MNAEDAFAPTQDRSHFFASSAANAVFAQLEQGLVHASPVIVITGEASVGKTSVLREACARWGARVRAEWLEAHGIAHDAFLPAITVAFGGHAGEDGSRSERVAELVRALAGIAENEKTPVLVLDDAHTLPSEMLAELARVVSAVAATKSRLRVVVVGQSELDKRLDDSAIADLVSIRTRLAPLPVPDVRPYLNHRLAASGGDGERAFSRRSARELHTVSRGVPGRIDAIASEAIRIARGTEAAQVSPEHVRAAVAAMQRPRTTAEPAATKAATAAPRTEPDAMRTTTPPAAQSTTHAAKPPSKPAAPARATTQPSVAPADGVTPSAAAPVANAASTPPAVPEPERASAPPLQPESPALDSRHPRVKEWVSRFTDGEGVLRFGARMQLPPLTEPDALPVIDDMPPVSAVTTRRMEHTLRSEAKPAESKPTVAAKPPAAPAPAPRVTQPTEPTQSVAPSKPAAAAPRVPEPVAFTPRAPEPVIADEPEPIAFVPQPEDDTEPVTAQRAPLEPQPEIVIVPEPIVLDPALLEPTPLVLDVPQPEPVATAPVPAPPAPPAPSPTRSHAPATPPSVPIAAPAPVPANVSNESNRSAKKRKRERERAARQAQQAGSSSAATPTSRSAAPSAIPVLTAAHATPKRKLTVDDSVLVEATALPVAGTPQPAHGNDGPRSPRHTSPFVQAAVPLLLMVGVASVAIFASTRTGFDQNRARTHVTAATPALPESADTVPPAAAGTKPQPVVDATPPKFCLAVGTYLFSDRAHAKAKQLARRTKLKTWVESTASDGSRSYRIMIGGFATESEAERAADRLLGRGLVGEALVEPITATRRRR